MLYLVSNNNTNLYNLESELLSLVLSYISSYIGMSPSAVAYECFLHNCLYTK